MHHVVLKKYICIVSNKTCVILKYIIFVQKGLTSVVKLYIKRWLAKAETVVHYFGKYHIWAYFWLQKFPLYSYILVRM